MRPLAERLRPTTLEGYMGQTHLLSPQGVLAKMIENKRLSSMILWGPPGVGKTTLARIISNALNVPFYTLSAIQSGVKDIRLIIEKANQERFFDTASPVLFIDEIHRFSKSQQDSLLGAVEQGVFTLIGATTENPSFEVISPLLSRCQVYTLKHLTNDELMTLLQVALAKDTILREKNIILKESDLLLQYAGGDARRLLNALEVVVQYTKEEKIVIDNAFVKRCLQENLRLYDKNGEAHYNTISAFIKSVRNSDADAAVYWLARMLDGGEDVKFIARRLIILASEDIGLANPNALLLANASFDAVHKIGMPEARITLSQCTIYLANSPKSNSAYVAINKALDEVSKTGHLPVPLHLRNASTKLMKDMGYGKGYKYAHDFEGGRVDQQGLPDNLKTTTFYTPKHPNEKK